MFSSPFLRRLFLPHLLVVCLAVAGMGIFSAVRIRSTQIQSRTQALREDVNLSTALVRETLTTSGPTRLKEVVSKIGVHNGARVTVIDDKGRVIADNWADADSMENHGARPEVLAAARNGEGTDMRISRTTRDELLYLARRFPGPGDAPYILRLAVPLPRLRSQSGSLYLATALAATLAMAASALICYRFAQARRRRSWNSRRSRMTWRTATSTGARSCAATESWRSWVIRSTNWPNPPATWSCNPGARRPS